MYNAILRMREYTLIGILSKFPDNKESHVLQRRYILGCLSNRNKGKVNRSISMFGYPGYLLDNDIGSCVETNSVWF